MKKTRYLNGILHVAVLAGLIYAGTKYINGDECWRAVRRFNWAYAPLILSLTTAYVLVKGWRFVFLLREFSDINRWVVLRGYVAAQAATLLPGGIAARAGIMEQIGVPLANSGAAVAHSSLADQAVLIACALVSALWFDAARKPALLLLTGLIVLSLLLGIEATRTWLKSIVEWILHRLRLVNLWHDFIESMKQVTTPYNILAGLGNAALAFALMVVALDLCVRGVGAHASYPTLLLAFTLPSLLGRISAMPGGVGVTEAGMVGILDSHPHITLDQAAAAVIIFRIGTVLFAAILGAVVYFFGWRGAAENTDCTPVPAAEAVAQRVAGTATLYNRHVCRK